MMNAFVLLLDRQLALKIQVFPVARSVPPRPVGLRTSFIPEPSLLKPSLSAPFFPLKKTFTISDCPRPWSLLSPPRPILPVLDLLFFPNSIPPEQQQKERRRKRSIRSF